MERFHNKGFVKMGWCRRGDGVLRLEEVGRDEFVQLDGGRQGIRGMVFYGHMAGVVIEKGKIVDGPAAAVEPNGIRFGEVQFLQRDAETAAVCFYEAFLGGPKMEERGHRRYGAMDGGPFRGGKVLFEPVEGKGFKDLDIDPDPGSCSQDTDDPISRVRDIELRPGWKKGFFPFGVLEAAQV
jgi:hypothetical protein